MENTVKLIKQEERAHNLEHEVDDDDNYELEDILIEKGTEFNIFVKTLTGKTLEYKVF